MKTIPKYSTLEKELLALTDPSIIDVDDEAIEKLFAGMSQEQQLAALEVISPGTRERIERGAQRAMEIAAALKDE